MDYKFKDLIVKIAICLTVLVGLIITENPICLWALFFMVLI